MLNKQQSVLDFIVKYKKSKNGNSPSYAQIAVACGISSTSHIDKILGKLAELGLIEREGVRSIEIPDSEWRMKEQT